MFVLTPKKDLKIYDYSSCEGDLNDPDYHKLALFRNTVFIY